MINRREFLKLSPLSLFACMFNFPPKQDGFDLVSAFAELGDGGVLDIPPGVHYIADTLRPGSGNYHIIRGNNAIIAPVGDFAGKPIVDLSSIKYGSFNNLRVLAGDNDSAFAGIYMGRGASDGAGHVLNQCVVQGAFAGAALYNDGAEGCVLNQCNLVTDNDKPAYYVDGPIAGLQHHTCAFRNYSDISGVPVVDLHGTLSGIVFDPTCYFYVGNNGIAIRATGPQYGVKVGGRVEGSGMDSRLIANPNPNNLYNWTIENVIYTIASDCMIETVGAIHESKLDFVHSAGCSATRYIQAVGTGPRVWRCEVWGNKLDWINTPGSVRMSHLIWTQGSPLVNPGDNIVHYVG